MVELLRNLTKGYISDKQNYKTVLISESHNENIQSADARVSRENPTPRL